MQSAWNKAGLVKVRARASLLASGARNRFLQFAQRKSMVSSDYLTCSWTACVDFTQFGNRTNDQL